MVKRYRPPGKKKEGNVTRFVTMTQALKQLQINLPLFRKLCILNHTISERVEITPIVEKLVENKIRWFGHVERRPVDAVIRSVYQMEVGANLSRAGCGNSHTSSGPIFFIISPAHNSVFIFSIEKRLNACFPFLLLFFAKHD
jgi:hypothetical protein